MPLSNRLNLRTAVLVVLFCAVAFAMPGAQADERGWVLTQRSITLGDQYVYISPSGIKIINPRQGIGSIVKSPNWDVLLFNDQTRLEAFVAGCWADLESFIYGVDYLM